MPTSKKRINITVSDKLDKAILLLAKRDQVPQATKVVELIKQAIELEEDLALEEILKERMKHKGSFITHEEVWSKIDQ